MQTLSQSFLSSQGHGRAVSQPSLAWKAHAAVLPSHGLQRKRRAMVTTAVVAGAVAPSYGNPEFDMPWSPVLVPDGPWKQCEGCVPLFSTRQLPQIGSVSKWFVHFFLRTFSHSATASNVNASTLSPFACHL